MFRNNFEHETNSFTTGRNPHVGLTVQIEGPLRWGDGIELALHERIVDSEVCHISDTFTLHHC